MIGGAYCNMGSGTWGSNYKWLRQVVSEIRKTDKCYVLKTTKGHVFFMSHGLNDKVIGHIKAGDEVQIRVHQRWYNTNDWCQNADKRGFFGIRICQY